jgi:hypothetical protein
MLAKIYIELLSHRKHLGMGISPPPFERGFYLPIGLFSKVAS